MNIMVESDAYKRELEHLSKINITLRPDIKKTTGKIGIFLQGQNGDCITASSVLKYRNILWSDKEIIWFCNTPNADFLKFSPVSEVRPYPNGAQKITHNETGLNFYELLCNEDNRLIKSKKND